MMDTLAQKVAARFAAEVAEGFDSRLPKLERIVESLESEVRQISISLAQYKQDSAKYKPQLKNVGYSAHIAASDLRALLHLLGEEG
jgi:hypothetical protein